jgi:hypothetical protein
VKPGDLTSDSFFIPHWIERAANYDRKVMTDVPQLVNWAISNMVSLDEVVFTGAMGRRRICSLNPSPHRVKTDNTDNTDLPVGWDNTEYKGLWAYEDMIQAFEYIKECKRIKTVSFVRGFFFGPTYRTLEEKIIAGLGRQYNDDGRIDYRIISTRPRNTPDEHY